VGWVIYRSIGNKSARAVPLNEILLLERGVRESHPGGNLPRKSFHQEVEVDFCVQRLIVVFACAPSCHIMPKPS
jgi:hypothetical protein